jgi:imidazole glycerol-phosphate synthase subunit HisF
MIRARLIPVLLLDRDRRLVKTVKFGQRTYIGDPFNVIRLFNEKEVDEICLLDIDASVDGRTADVGFIAELAAECFMPLSYGGGINASAPVDRLARNGVEKFIIGHEQDNHDFVRSLVAEYGTQAVVGCVDYRSDGVYSRSGRDRRVGSPLERAQQLAGVGVGEIILQSIDRDGTRTGMDLDTICAVSGRLDVPVVALGGAGTVAHLEAALTCASAAASGSTFSFIGRLRAVLITYPTIHNLPPERTHA